MPVAFATSMVTRLRNMGKFARRAWALAAPYWSSEERWRARALLATIVGLTLGLVGLTVLYNDWNRSFFEAIQDKDVEAFGPLLIRFGVLAASSRMASASAGVKPSRPILRAHSMTAPI